MIATLAQLAYVVATALFILALHWLNDPKTARQGANHPRFTPPSATSTWSYQGKLRRTRASSPTR